MNEDEVAANFSFLAMDESTKDAGLVRKHRSKAEGVVDTHNKVFVWGLNDRGQLGSELSDSKVRVTCSSSLALSPRPFHVLLVPCISVLHN